MRHGASERVLLQRYEPKSFFFRTKGCREPGRTGADYDNVEQLVVVRACDVADGVHSLAALFHRISYQAHTAELASNVDARDIRLEIRLYQGNIYAASFGTENQLYGIGRTGFLAGSVPNAV